MNADHKRLAARVRELGYANLGELRTAEGGTQFSFVPRRGSDLPRRVFYTLGDALEAAGILPDPPPATNPEPAGPAGGFRPSALGPNQRREPKRFGLRGA